MQKNLIRLLYLIMILSPVFVYASGGDNPDTSFTPIYDQIKSYLNGSLGKVLVILGFLGAAAAMAGFAPMKIMFPVFGLTLIVSYGPTIIDNIMAKGATGDSFHAVQQLTTSDIIVLMFAIALFVAGYVRHKHKKVDSKSLSQ